MPIALYLSLPFFLILSLSSNVSINAGFVIYLTLMNLINAGLMQIKYKSNYGWYYFAIRPFYLLLHTLPAYKALFQFIFKPFYWEKTTHSDRTE
jgi:hypothetical protein